MAYLTEAYRTEPHRKTQVLPNRNVPGHTEPYRYLPRYPCQTGHDLTSPCPTLNSRPEPDLPSLAVSHHTPKSVPFHAVPDRTEPRHASPHHVSPRSPYRTEPHLVVPRLTSTNREIQTLPCRIGIRRSMPGRAIHCRNLMPKLSRFFKGNFYRCKLFNFVATMTWSPIADANIRTRIFKPTL